AGSLECRSGFPAGLTHCRTPFLTPAVKVTLEVPDEVSKETKTVAEHKAHESAVLAVWEAGEILTRQAAAELGLTYYDFLDLLAVRGIPVERGPLNLEAVEDARKKLAYQQACQAVGE